MPFQFHWRPFMPRDPSMRAHGRRYTFEQYGNPERATNQGNFLIRNNMADLWSPCYGDGYTVVRILPQLNPDDATQWDTYRLSAEPNAFGDWIRRYPAVRNMGDPGATFIVGDPSDPVLLDPRITPAWLLRESISRAVERGQDRRGGRLC
jgi:hypothetical protein